MIVRDWHAVAPLMMAPIYEREASRWQVALAWDMTSSWSTVETARTTWGLPGLICLSDDDHIHGWTFYMSGDRGLDIGGIIADSGEVTAALVAALVTRAGSPARVHGFFYAAAPCLLKTLTGHAVPFARYSYKRRLLRSGAPTATVADAPVASRCDIHPWSEADFDETVNLLHRSYERQDSPFGHDATVQQWGAYLHDMTEHDGCGQFSTSLSSALRIDGALGAVSLVSSISPHSAHVVQLVVDPSQQRGGLGRALLGTTAERAAVAGFTSLSLLVAEDNEPAMQLYAKAGFFERALFVRLGSAFAVDQCRRRN